AYLSWLPPWWAYAAWAGVTLATLFGCGYALARHASSPERRLLVIASLIASPVSYLLLLYGNVHGVIVAAAALLLLGLHELASAARPALGVAPWAKVALGLCLSLLCKPVLVLVVPALLVTRATRRAALASLAAYAVLSALLLLVPAANPESVGLERLAWLALHPGWVRAQLDVYQHRFVLIPDMLDNAMHWFHMLVQSDNTWDHVQIFSLPVMLRGIAPDAGGVLRAFALAPVLLAPGLWRVPEPRRASATAWLVVLALASHFLGYAIAWEYQYTQLLVVTGALLALSTFEMPHRRWSRLALAGLAVLYLPTPYAWIARDGISPAELAVLRVFRVGPALVVAAAAIGAFVEHMLGRGAPASEGASTEAMPRFTLQHAQAWLARARQRPVSAIAAGAGGVFVLAPLAILLAARAVDTPSAEARTAEVERLIARSRVLLDAAQARESLTPLERARRLAPDSLAVQNNLCVAYGILERRNEAVERCRRAVELAPEDVLARNNLAWVESLRAE
ncbi:MAG TPA: hypothetical protein VMG12_30475, partial [Polyangiaceae bacterium]|nr:hypothetical protein [Polyangiaceae bacterium]